MKRSDFLCIRYYNHKDNVVNKLLVIGFFRIIFKFKFFYYIKL